MVIRSRDQLQDAIAEMLAHNGPVLVDARVTKDENCYPMVAPAKQCSDDWIARTPSVGTLNQNMYCSSCGAKKHQQQ